MQMKPRDDNLKWFTESEYVDIETGEMIQRYQIESKQYYKIKYTVNYEIDEQKRIGIKKYTHECRNTGQTKLF